MWRSVVPGALLLVLFLAELAGAQEPRRIRLQITVSHASTVEGEIDPELRGLYDQLQGEFRYRSLHLLQRKNIVLSLDEVGQMRLPNGSWVRVRPLAVSGPRVLVATEVQGAVRSDLRMHNRKPVVIVHPQVFQGGRLVISFEPRF